MPVPPDKLTYGDVAAQAMNRANVYICPGLPNCRIDTETLFMIKAPNTDVMFVPVELSTNLFQKDPNELSESGPEECCPACCPITEEQHKEFLLKSIV